MFGHGGQATLRDIVRLVAVGAMLLAAIPSVSLAFDGTFSVRDHDAKGLAMGGAVLTLSGGDAAIFWNPARMPFRGFRSVTIAHGDMIEDFSSGLTTISASIPWGGHPTDEYGLGLSPKWAIGCFISHFGLDEVAGSANWSETAVSGAVARSLWGFAAAGLSFRYLNVGSDIDEGGASGAAADLALSLDTTDRTRAALVLRNMFSTLSWESGRDEKLLTTVDLAFSYTHGNLGKAETSLNVDSDGVATAAIGAEISLAEGGLVLWGGFKRINDDTARNVPSLGVGIPVGSLEFGYGASFDDDQIFGTIQRLSISARF
jgi:hypothetical protein